MRTNPRRLPFLTSIAVAWMGREVPAWIERGARRVYSIVGEVGFGAAVLLVHEIRHKRVLGAIKSLKEQLHRWGYRSVETRHRRPAKERTDNRPGRRSRASPLMDGSNNGVETQPGGRNERRDPSQRRLAAPERPSESPPA